MPVLAADVIARARGEMLALEFRDHAADDAALPIGLRVHLETILAFPGASHC